jgi:hypothetical protein
MQRRKTLAVKDAKRFLKPVELNDFETIDDEAAKLLATYASYVFLDGLTSLSGKAAKALARHKGALSLDGLGSLPEEGERTGAGTIAGARCTLGRGRSGTVKTGEAMAGWPICSAKTTSPQYTSCSNAMPISTAPDPSSLPSSSPRSAEVRRRAGLDKAAWRMGFLQRLVCPLCVPFQDFESNVLFPKGRCGKLNSGFGGFMTGLISTSAASWPPPDDSGARYGTGQI